MAGIATGLALSGKIVFTYSIANFPILRCLEQLRNDVCYHQANVVSVSVGCGFSYGYQKGKRQRSEIRGRSADYLSACAHLPAAPTAQVDAQAGADYTD